MNRRTVFAVAALAAASFAATAHGATTYTFPGCATTLQGCIDAASSGDILRLANPTAVVGNMEIAGKSLRIEAAPGVTPVVRGFISVTGGAADTRVAIEGLTLEGSIAASPATGNLELFVIANRIRTTSVFGFAVLMSSSHQPVGNMTFEVVNNDVHVVGNGPSAQCGGIGYGGASDSGTAQVTIAGNRVNIDDCGQGRGILAYSADDTMSAAIIGNRVSAAGTTNGILVSGGPAGATATIAGNVVTRQKNVAGASAAIAAIATGTDDRLAVDIVNNTVSFNETGIAVSGRSDLGAQISAVVANNVVTHNTKTGLYLDDDFSATIAGSHNLVFGNQFDSAGAATIVADPRFVAAPHDLRLALDSPAVNSGDTAAVPSLLDRDLDGRARVIGGEVDRGAYEYPGPFPPAAPTQLAATASSAHTVLLDWQDASDDEDSFLIERWNGAEYVPAGAVGAEQTSVLVPGLEAATIHTFRVRAHGPGGVSAPSNEATAETWAANDLPAAPLQLVAKLIGPDTVRLQWHDESNDEDSFVIQRRSGGDFTTVTAVVAGSESVEISGLGPGTLYGFRVRAHNRAGLSAPSNVAEIATPVLCQGEDVACLGDDRFAVAVTWTTPDGEAGSAHPKILTKDSASFWFFESTNVELLVKVLDGCSVNDRFWVFATGLTNVETRVTVTDSWTGQTALYVNPQHRPFEPIQDTAALGGCDTGGHSQPGTATPTPTISGCEDGDGALCLQDNRYRVEALWRTDAGQSGRGHAVALTADSGTFWFFDQANVELVVKVLDACSEFERFWVFAGGLTNVEVELRITDQETGATRTYRNPQGQPFRPLQDTEAFATCR